MKKILKILGMISALILSVLGLSACSKDGGAVALYGVVEPPYEGLSVNEGENENGVKESFPSVNQEGIDKND